MNSELQPTTAGADTRKRQVKTFACTAAYQQDMVALISRAALVVQTVVNECPGGHGRTQALQAVREVAACCLAVEGVFHQPKHDGTVCTVAIACTNVFPSQTQMQQTVSAWYRLLLHSQQ